MWDVASITAVACLEERGILEMALDVDYLKQFIFSFFFFFSAVIMGSSNPSSAWVVCLFFLENHPRVELVIQHRGILNFPPLCFSTGQPMYF